jgi:hypothetical protein
VSDDCCTTLIEYEPPTPAPAVLPDFGGEFPWLLIIPFLILVAAIIYLMTLPATKKDPPKTVKEQINSAFDAINQEANLYNRSYVIGPLEKARKKVIEILDKEL